MELVNLEDIFEVKYGNKFDANKMIFASDGGINFVSRDSENNGIVGIAKKYNEIEPFDEGLITVSLGGSFLLSGFVQPKKFYTAQNVAVLKPKREMKINEKLFYCKCISMNRFRYSAFGREANKTLKYLEVPKEVPKWVYEVKIMDYSKLNRPFSDSVVELNVDRWKPVKISDIFDVKGSKTTSIRDIKSGKNGKYPYLTTQSTNNGVGGYYDFFTDEGNVLVVDSAVKGFCSYQPENFSASDHVEKLIPKFEMNGYIAMFLTKLINLEQYRYSYGRKFHQDRIKDTVIKLPMTDEGNIDWRFLENFVKSLKYSSSLLKSLI